ncbi:alginate biosynthesis protein [Devosia sp. ZB163]|uniref:alginate O-acetyltransferase AlgX-related protein n=1 Tax=Devosia sp. ZB163 TaxID=3025938 RepID=UPI00236177E4|nr:alginate biosynthesis protein [Devosia sp. ZB163]MDC9824265.1 alginate biosynthesis protein [Devosia sp. ZB163]
MNKSLLLGAALAALLSASPALAANSAFGCKHLEDNPTLPSVEGRDGFFFRIFADLRMQHPFTEDTTTQMGKLAEALKAHGTTMLYVPIPTKSVTLPTFLPDEARLFGFDEDVAVAVYEDQVARLNAKGVIAVDLLSALRTTDGNDPPFFKSDFHWTSRGAETAAKTIGGTIKQLPAYADVTPVTYETRATGAELAVSGMRRTLQAYCVESLPPVISTSYETVEVASADASLDIFGDSGGAEEGATNDEIALVGTSFSDALVPNFSGFLAQYASLPVANMAITGGNQFGAITSYLTSREFQANRPKFLVWENPIYNNLAQFGTGSLTELIAAARNDCQPVGNAPVVDRAKGLYEADLTGTPIAPNQVLLADAGDDGSRDVVLNFESTDGRTFTREVHRGDRFRGTGRFFIPLESLDSLELSKVSITFDRLSEEKAAISLCNT